ncbi:alginate lyase family protein [Hufsiella ginkgonis]|uniref:Alginate lyase n=1 Tax=Hufsiella ginkgonis TaxID=2695274 RepID=A0A7K1XWJ6_9SPHI|nr:alginate lyase family protein [Hufsiella ginkgonis]MXV15149.1 alginate lyase [Hufsiella ginkgonis]
MKTIRLFIFFLLAGFSANGQVISLNKKEISVLKRLVKNDPGVKNRYVRYEKAANAALADTPDPADTVFSEGRLASDPKKIVTAYSLLDLDKIYALALAYRITGDKKYLHKAALFLTAWGKRNQPNGNPINDTKFEHVFEAFDLVKDALTPADRRIVSTWFSKMADAEINNPRFNGTGATGRNNWNSHRLMVIGLIGYAVNDRRYQQYALAELPKHIEKNLYADGSGLDFHDRDALHYHVYSLEPLLSLVTTLKRAGETDYYSFISASGSSIRGSVKFLEPFVTGEKTHEEFVNSKTDFDRARANNNEPNFKIGALFKPDHGARVFSQAAFFDPALFAIAKKGYANEEAYPDWQSVLAKVKR